MKEINKKIAAIAMAGFLMGTTSGCSNNNENSVRYEEAGKEELTGNVTLSDLVKYNIVVVSDFENKNKFYLAYEHVYDSPVAPGPDCHYTDYEKIGSNIVIAKKYKYKDKIESNFGNIENIIEFSPIVAKYGTIKDIYDIKELEEILVMFENDYDKYRENIKTKSLTLK